MESTTKVVVLYIGTGWRFHGNVRFRGPKADIARAVTVLGFSEAPWKTFDHYVDLITERQEQGLSTNRSREERAAARQLVRDLERAKDWHWKYAYTALASTLIFATHFFFLWLAIKVTRRFVSEQTKATTWMLKAGLQTLLLGSIFLLAAGMLLILGLFISPVTWLAPFFLNSASVFVATFGAAISALSGWIFAGPWLRAVLISAILPCLALILLSGAALTVDLQKVLRNHARGRSLEATRRVFGDASVPLLVVLLTLLFGGGF